MASVSTAKPASDTKAVSRLLLKSLLLVIPYLPIVVSYFVLDPFRVLYDYKKFDEPLTVVPNRDYISTQMYLNTYQQRPYSSFILGNSRTMSFLTRDWVKYTGDSLAFHYDASGESLYGVGQKLQFVEQHNSSLKNVLIICDQELLKMVGDVDNHIYRKDPRTTGDFSFAFQLAFLKAYFSDTFFFQYLKQRVTGKFTPEMFGILEDRRIYYDPVTNDMVLPDINAEIKRDSVGFYARNRSLRLARKAGVSDAVIGPEQLRQLVAMRNIFKRHNTNYHIVISPLFKQQQLNPADLALLQRTFGASHIHDYSGVNEFTKEVGNYYEQDHYRPLVGRKILEQIYAPRPQ
ncbi:hypothetical protein [Hymenobacter chitinivorans]|uniref:Uncharacterized protein n=1 Tax=Hymenobacter chitinivorans DSM 11115 TaxID=1121954 RepID=A0A2M9BQ02_9BACT|nr:hypothetical protein [Hymenobacter chitinivorans]PJJ60013.1 hypothetical protein CLV45_1438 [Hymenobacter chitinivorans DSM 11115]